MIYFEIFHEKINNFMFLSPVLPELTANILFLDNFILWPVVSTFARKEKARSIVKVQINYSAFSCYDIYPISYWTPLRHSAFHQW